MAKATALVAGGDEHLGVGPHEGDCHRHFGAVRQHEVPVRSDLISEKM
jgi:hypothetical protein